METYADWAIHQAMKDHGVFEDEPTDYHENPDREYEWRAGK
ncbi:hypothetical protein ACVNSK_10595 [Corynebacterium propinquum]